MRLKTNINSVDFFRAIDRCTGDVLLRTKEADILNLRSQLCRYIFAVAFSEGSFFERATVECQEYSDYEILIDFLEK